MTIRKERLTDYALAEDIQGVNDLLDKGSYTKQDLNSAFLVAATKGHYVITNMLIISGANIHSKEDDALWWSACNGHDDVVRLLLEHGAEARTNLLDQTINGTHYSPRCLITARTLKEQGIELSNKTATFQQSAELEHFDVMQILIDWFDCDINIVLNYDKATAKTKDWCKTYSSMRTLDSALPDDKTQQKGFKI